MQKLFSCLLLACLGAATFGCSSTDNGIVYAAAIQSAPASGGAAVRGSCLPGAVNAGKGTVTLQEGPLKGDFTSCDMAAPLNQMIAFQARRIPSAVGVPVLTVVAPAKTGEADCTAGSQTAVNYTADSTQSGQPVFVAKGDKLGKCKITTTAYDQHHWSGSLTASLVPASGKAAPITIKAKWDLQN